MDLHLIINTSTSYIHSNSSRSPVDDFVVRNLRAIYAFCAPFSLEEPTINRIKRFHIEPSFGPAVWQFLYPPELVRACYSLIEAIKLKNKELIDDTKLNLLRIVTGTLYSASYLSVLAAQISIVFHRTLLPAVAPFVPVIGLISSVICGFIEIKIRQVHFISECNHHLAALKAGQTPPETLAFLKTFMPPNDPSEVNHNFTNLASRVRLWFLEEFIKEIEDTLPKLIDRLEKPTTAESQAKWALRATRFVNHVKIQAEKKLILQVISVAAIALLLFSFIAALLALPYLIPGVIIGAYFTVLIGNYIHDSGTQSHLGWEFRPSECIPKFFKKCLGMNLSKPNKSVFRKKYKVLSETEQVSFQRFNSGIRSTSRKLSSKDFTVG
jgi:hypothetical protein